MFHQPLALGFACENYPSSPRPDPWIAPPPDRKCPGKLPAVAPAPGRTLPLMSLSSTLDSRPAIKCSLTFPLSLAPGPLTMFPGSYLWSRPGGFCETALTKWSTSGFDAFSSARKKNFRFFSGPEVLGGLVFLGLVELDPAPSFSLPPELSHKALPAPGLSLEKMFSAAKSWGRRMLPCG